MWDTIQREGRGIIKITRVGLITLISGKEDITKDTHDVDGDEEPMNPHLYQTFRKKDV